MFGVEPPKRYTLPAAAEIVRRLTKVNDDTHFHTHLHPKLAAACAGQTVTSEQLIEKFMEVRADYLDKDTPNTPNIKLLSYHVFNKHAAQYAAALIDDEGFLEEVHLLLPMLNILE